MIAGPYLGLLLIGILLLVLTVWLLNRLLVRDITRHKQEEQLSLLQTITMEVAAAEDLSSALAVVLRRVCEKTGWDIGQSWLPRRGENVLELGPVWVGDSGELERFQLASKKTSFQPGEGLPGRVWKSKHSAWLEDVTRDRNFPRAKMATECGLKAALAIPILAKDDVIAVIEFFLREPRPEDERLVKVITAIATQLGLAFERKRAEEELRQHREHLEELVGTRTGELREKQQVLLSILEATPESLILLDRDGRIVTCNEVAARRIGKRVSDLVNTCFASALPAEIAKHRQTLIDQAIQKRSAVVDEDERNGTCFQICYNPVLDSKGEVTSLVVLAVDVTRRRQAEDALAAEKNVLEKAAAGSPLAELLDQLVRGVEAQSRDGMICSVLLIDETGKVLRHGAARIFPAPTTAFSMALT